MEKTFYSEYGELLSVDMKELTVNCGAIRNFAAFFNISAHLLHLLEFMGQLSHAVPGPKNLASPPLEFSILEMKC